MQQRLALKRQQFSISIRRSAKQIFLKNRRKSLITATEQLINSENLLQLVQNFVIEILLKRTLEAHQILHKISRNSDLFFLNPEIIKQLSVFQFPQFLVSLLRQSSTTSQISEILEVIVIITEVMLILSQQLAQELIPFADIFVGLLNSPHQKQILKILSNLLKINKNGLLIKELQQLNTERFLHHRILSNPQELEAELAEFISVYFSNANKWQKQPNQLLIRQCDKFMKRTYLKGVTHIEDYFAGCSFNKDNELDFDVLHRIFKRILEGSINTAISITCKNDWVTLNLFPVLQIIILAFMNESNNTKVKIEFMRLLTNFLINSDSKEFNSIVLSQFKQLIEVFQNNQILLLESRQLFRYLMEAEPDFEWSYHANFIEKLLGLTPANKCIHQLMMPTERCCSCQFLDEIISAYQAEPQ